MITILSSIRRSVTIAKKHSPLRRVGLLALAVLCGWTSTVLAAPYNFMTVSGTNVPGNGITVSTFTSGLKNGVITVDHNSTTPNSLGNWGTQDNINSAIFPSVFATLFPGSGNVDGHLAQSMYGDPSTPVGAPGPIPNVTTVTFNLNTYTGSLPNLVFGLWNTTDEVALPAYDIKFLDASNVIVSPTFNLIGNQDNQAQVAGRHMMQIDAFGNITAPTLLNASGTHTDAMFFDGIPTGTQQIIVTATLPALNNLGDGVGYYFAEPVPEPSSFVLAAMGIVSLYVFRRRRKR